VSRSRSQLLFGLAMALVVLSTTGGSPLQSSPGEPEFVAGEVLIRFQPGALPDRVSAIRDELGAQDLHRFASGGLHWKLGPGVSVEQAIERFRNHPLVRFIEPNYVLSIDVVPNDPRLGELWGLINTGQTGGTPDADIDADMAWNVSTGSDQILVGVIDTGIDYNHPDLAPNVWTNPGEIPGNGIDDDGNGYVDDIHGWDFYNNDGDPFDDHSHGTHCAGTIGAVGNDGIGVAGVNWHVKIMGLKFLGSGGSGSTANAVLAVDYATMMGVRLTSNSWGGGGYSQELYDAIARANAANIAFVAAAGNGYGQNTDVTPNYPSAYDLPNIIAVAATDHNDQLADFSNYGPTTVDLGAPGVNILSTTPGNTYGTKSGTSMATPHTAGVAALILSVNPNVPVSQMKSVLLSATDPIPALAGRCVSGGRLNAFFAIAEPDTVPPGQIDDLATTEATSNTMFLSWTATGDDGSEGTASFHELRYSTAPIDGTNWDAATRAGNEPPPEAAGTPQAMEVSGLEADTMYYFAIKAFDEWGNGGPISNLATGSTLPPPTATVDPTSVSDDLFTGETSDHAVTLTNVGVGTLDFTIPAPVLSEPYGAPAEPLELAKGEADPRQGAPITAGAGGPDPFGYRWIDSDEAGGPVFNWTDISTTGVQVALTSDDQTSTPVALGFDFPMYGTLFDSIRVCTNGWLSFTDSSTAYSNQPLPTSAGPANMIAPFWDDLHPHTAGRVFFQNFGNQAIVQWDAYERYSGAGSYTFQAILDSSGAITLQYLTMTGDVTSATVGVQDASKTVGLQVAFNQAYLHDNLAVRISAIPLWLSAAPTSGRLAAGQSKLINVHMDASGLEGGNYPATLNILTNDPANPTLPVDVNLHVIGAPDAEVQPTAIDFGETFLGIPLSQTLTVVNNGTDTLFVTDVVPSHAELDPQPRSFSVPPHGSFDVDVNWTPSALGPFGGSVTVLSNDAGEPSIEVPCTGTAIPAPAMIYSPTSFAETLYTGHAVTRTLTVRNTGGSDLLVDAGVDLGNGIVVYAPDEGATGAGGPDAFGYSWKDSDESGGPTYDFVDISTTGTQVTFSSADDSIAGPFPLGMTFPFYGANFSQFKVSTNGWMTFNTSETSSRAGNYNFPSTSGAANMIALFWDDLHLRTAGRVHYLYDGTRFILQFTNVDKYSPSGATLTFQAQLYPNGKILLVYRTMTGTTNGATIGIQDGTKTIGLAANYNASYVHDAMAVQFSLTPDWLQVTPNHAVIPPGGSFDFDVTFDSTDRLAGVLAGAVVLDNNIPEQARVPATLTVIGAPIVATVPGEHDFGTQFLGYPYTTQFRVVNAGTDTLTVYDVYATDPSLEVTEPPAAEGGDASTFAQFDLAPGASRLFDLRWYPTSPMAMIASVRVNSTDPVSPNFVMPVTGTAIPAPIAGWSPGSFTESLMVDDVVHRTLRLTNSGGSDLTYDLGVYLDSGAVVSVDASPELKKGEEDTRPGTLGSGGPDAFGYTWRDSDEPGGPTFDWVDISSIGTEIPFASSDDSNYGPIPIGFSFPFYGTDFDTIRAGTNGFLSFTSTSTSLTNYLLPSTSAPENLLAVFHDDLHRRNGHAFYYNDGSRFIIQYQNWDQYSPSGQIYNFQVILHRNGRIVYQYLDMTTDDLAGATVGIQNAARNDGLTVVYNAAYVHDALAVEFRPPLSWLSVTPESGVVPPGASVDLDVLFDTTEMIGGDYAASIDVATNDPARASFSVPVAMHLTGIPDVDATPASLSYPMTYVGFFRTDQVVITNVGTDVLHISGVEVTGDFGQSGLTPPVALPVGGTVAVTVTFTPTTDGIRTGELRVASDDPDEPTFVVPLDGFALFPPEIDVDPPAIQTALPPGGSRTKTETVCNTGRSDLEWSATTNILSAQAGGAMSVHEALDLGKEEVDPRPGTLGSGGPDVFGYTWKDSDEAGGPMPAWFDISGIGTQIQIGTSGYCDDCNVGPFPIGFAFNFYGNSFSDFRLSTNGWVSFTNTTTDFSNDPLPSAGGPENLLAVFWDDLVHRSGAGSEPVPSTIHYYNDGTRLIIQYSHMYRIASYSDDLNFQVILYPSGKVEYQYATMASSTLNSATIGIQNATRDDGLMVVYNSAYVHDDLAVEFSRFPEWVQLDPTAGIIPAGGCQDVTVTLDAAGLDDGIHDAEIYFSSNDPYTPLVTVPVSLNVSLVAATWAEFSPDVLNLSSNGNFVMMTVQLPTDLDPYAIAVESVMLNDVVPALTQPPPEYGDRNGDGIVDVRFKFDRQAAEATMPVGQEVPVYIQGEVADVQWWRGMDTIRTMHPRLTAPNGGEYLLGGSVVPIVWDAPAGGNVHHYEVQLSRDGGATWEVLDDNVRATRYDWTVTGELTGDAWIRLLAMDSQGVMGYDWSDGSFVIADSVLHPPVPIGGTLLMSVNGTSVDLSWKAPIADPMHGPADRYRILRGITPVGLSEVAVIANGTTEYSETVDETAGDALVYYVVVAGNAAGDEAP